MSADETRHTNSRNRISERVCVKSERKNLLLFVLECHILDQRQRCTDYQPHVFILFTDQIKTIGHKVLNV